MTKIFTDADFYAEVIDSEQPVLVDFWAPWCGPCQAVGPTIDQLAEELDGAVKVGKANVEETAEAAQRYGVSSIPTVALFRNGVLVDRLVGIQSKDAYLQLAAGRVPAAKAS